MEAIEHLKESYTWEHPKHYGGFSPDGDYLIYSRTRDSSILENINYEGILDCLQKEASNYEYYDVHKDREKYERHFGMDEIPFVYDFRAGHPLCGWVEYILVRADAPEDFLQEAAEIVCSMADYPVFDEMAYSEAIYEALQKYWEDCSLKERVEYCKEAGLSIFVARYEYIPEKVEHLLDGKIY